MWNDFTVFLQRCHVRLMTLDLKREEGQGLVEYGLILGLVSVVAISALTKVGEDVKVVFEKIVTSLGSA